MANGHIKKNQRHNETLSLSSETVYHQTRLEVAGSSEDAG